MNDLEKWWDKLTRAPDEVREIMMRQWDDTGRPSREIIHSYIELLALAKDDHATFRTMYCTFMEDMKAPSILKNEADVFFAIYMQGKTVGIVEIANDLN